LIPFVFHFNENIYTLSEAQNKKDGQLWFGNIHKYFFILSKIFLVLVQEYFFLRCPKHFILYFKNFELEKFKKWWQASKKFNGRLKVF
jgi:hypothetical protein